MAKKNSQPVKRIAKPRTSGGGKAKTPGRTPAARKKAALPRKPAAKPARKPARSGKPMTEIATTGGDAPVAKKKAYVSEENRGGHFFTKIRVWRILHDAEPGTIFNKQMLAERFFSDIDRDEDPDPEPVRDLLENDPDADWLADDDSDDMPDEMSDTRDGGRSDKLARAYNRIRERHKRRMQRAIEALQKCGVEIDEVDKVGNNIPDDVRKERRESKSSVEKWYRYNPDGYWARQLERLLMNFRITGTELVAMMALRDLLEDMRGTPHQKALQDRLEAMEKCVPPDLRQEALEQSRAYRHSVGNTAKYLKKAELLELWYASCLNRMQIKIRYTVPGRNRTETRHLAAMSTVFNREENSLFLLGSEKTIEGWGKVKQWKLDRVSGVEETKLKNPRLADLPPHALIRPAPGGFDKERLDADRVFDYSAGAWLELDAKPRRLEIVLRVPTVGRPGMPNAELEVLKASAERRAYNWMAWCREKPFHPRQLRPQMEPAPGGGEQMRLVVERCYVTEMASRLLRLQDCFEVIEPPELVELIRDHALAIAKAHGA